MLAPRAFTGHDDAMLHFRVRRYCRALRLIYDDFKRHARRSYCKTEVASVGHRHSMTMPFIIAAARNAAAAR